MRKQFYTVASVYHVSHQAAADDIARLEQLLISGLQPSARACAVDARGCSRVNAKQCKAFVMFENMSSLLVGFYLA